MSGKEYADRQMFFARRWKLSELGDCFTTTDVERQVLELEREIEWDSLTRFVQDELLRS